MALAISYIRFSSKKQEEGDSVRRQRKLATDWVAKNDGYTLSDITYEDLGLSASKGHHLNGNLGKILEAVESGAIPSGSVILVETLDRFSRLPTIDTLTMLQKVVTKGVDLITLTDNQRYNAASINGTQLFMLAAAAMAAYDYSKTLARRVAESYDGRAAKAKAGKAIKRRNGFWLTSDGQLNEHSTIVVEVFNKFVNGVSIRALAKQYEIFANASSVRKLLQNIAVCGHWQRYDKKRQPTDLIRDVFSPAITEVLFHQAQQMMDKQLHIQQPSKNPIVGLAVCAECGKNFAKKNANTKTATATMACYSRMTDKKLCGNSKGVPVPVIQYVFWETMKGAVYHSLQQTKLTSTDTVRILLSSKIAANEGKKAKLLRLIMASETVDGVLEEAYAAVQQEAQQLTTELNSLPTDDERGEVTMEEIVELINGDPMVLSSLLRLSGYRILCNAEGELFVGGEGGAWEGGESSQFTYQYIRKSRGYLVTGRGGDAFVDC